MKYAKTLLVAVLALAAVVVTSSTASADRIQYSGSLSSIRGGTVDFPNIGSISLTAAGSTSNCPLRLIGNFHQKVTLADGLVNIGEITAANPNPIVPDPACSANTVTLAGFPWLVAATQLLADGGIAIRVLGVTANVGPCSFRGAVSALIAPAAANSAVTGIGGTLDGGACGPATVRGSGGVFVPGARLIV